MAQTSNTEPIITFIGAGNMATSLIGGLCSAGHDPERMHAVDPSAERRSELHRIFGVHTHADVGDAALPGADVWVLAVKPQVMAEAVRDLAPRIGDTRPLVISIAAGVPLAALRRWLGLDLPLVRCMPNTPALIGAGATGLYAEDGVSTARRQTADAMLATAGTTVWVDSEHLLDAITATSGSGPAYFFAFMEAMQAGAEALGLDADTARELVLATALGAARMARESGDAPGTLRRKVTSPGGTTERALTAFDEADMQAVVANAMHAAAERAAALARTLDDQ